jgi:diketogulonate reductase-like aldo/keto reductase
MRMTKLPSGESAPVLGQGTWGMGEKPENKATEIDAIRFALDLHMSVIDTAEMYGNGASEELVGKAITGRRSKAFVVSKILPQHATREGTIAACERSLRRLATDRIDLYLLHWRGQVPLQETLEAFDDLVRTGKIRYWGVSNFDVSEMEQLAGLSNGGAVTTDQVLYNLMRRGIEYDLLPWCDKRNIPVMAYSPFEQGRLLDRPVLKHIADEYVATPAQIALAWVLRRDRIIAVPKAASPGHVKANRIALDIPLSNDDFAELDRAFPPPTEKRPLEVI